MLRTLVGLLLLVPFLVSAVPGATDDDVHAPLERRASRMITTCKKKGQFALTYDDGVWMYEKQVATTLDKAGATGTFFVNGNNYACIYDPANVAALKTAYKQGHLIGSHTWTHIDITTISNDYFNKQLDLVETALKKIIGVKPKYFRPPYGAINAEKQRILTKRGYVTVLWSVDSGDSAGKTPAESSALYSQLAKQYPKPQIALNHETNEGTVKKVTPHAIKVLKKAGYKLVSVAECLGDDHPYQRVGKPGKRDATWTCSGTPAPPN